LIIAYTKTVKEEEWDQNLNHENYDALLEAENLSLRR
jgi:hypothetical protein